MPMGMLGIYCLLFYRLFVCPQVFLVTDISVVGWRRAMKFCRVVDLGVNHKLKSALNCSI